MMPQSETAVLCSMRVGDDLFGIDTQKVHEVLRGQVVHPVPLSPEFVGGVLAYRGDVLLVLSFRKLLGMACTAHATSVLVLRDEAEDELFGLAVDAVEDVLRLETNQWEENPCTLDARRKMLFAGAYKLKDGLVVRLEPESLRPARLAELMAGEALAMLQGGRAMCGH